MFKIITFNANGIRAAARKGFFQWLNAQDADAVCIQETKAQLPQLEGDATYFPFAHNHYHDAEKKGYSGVALYLKHPPQQVQHGIGWAEIDSEGRYLDARAAAGERLILCGDINIAHTEKDLKNWKGNLKNSGFLPQERAWLTELFAGEFRDAFRLVHPELEQYTWWSQRGNARANNVGWRIDYQIVSANLAAAVESASVYTGENFSDHAPLIITYRDLQG